MTGDTSVAEIKTLFKSFIVLSEQELSNVGCFDYILVNFLMNY